MAVGNAGTMVDPMPQWRCGTPKEPHNAGSDTAALIAIRATAPWVESNVVEVVGAAGGRQATVTHASVALISDGRSLLAGRGCSLHTRGQPKSGQSL